MNAIKKKHHILISLLIFMSCAQVNQGESEGQKVNDLADRYHQTYFAFYPERGTILGIEEADHSGLSDNSMEGILSYQAAEDSIYAQVKTINPDNLTTDDLITYVQLKEALEASIGKRVCNNHLWTINHVQPFYSYPFNEVFGSQPTGDAVARTAALERWRNIPAWIRNDMDNNRLGLDEGYALPRSVIERVIAQLDLLLESPLESNVFYAPALRDSTEAFQTEMERIAIHDIMPVVEEYAAFLNDTYLEHARDEPSISAIPNGSQCYEALIRQYTSLPLTPEELMAMGEQARESMNPVIREIGMNVYGTDDLQEIRETFQADTANYFSSREEVLRFAEDAVNRAKSRIPDYFVSLPAAEVIVEAVPEIEEQAGFIARYASGPQDGSRPGVYYQNTYRPETRSKAEVETVAFHETYPGHHLQTAVMRESMNLHPISDIVSLPAYNEGWATYAEILADQMGLHSSEKNRLALAFNPHLSGDPLIIEPGIHHLNWTRDQTVDYIITHVPLPLPAGTPEAQVREMVEGLVDFMSALPAYGLNYGVGYSYFMKLRNEAEEALGPDFDLKEFHDECLKYGKVPFPFLETRIREWIERKKQKI